MWARPDYVNTVELPVPPETRERVGEHHRRRRGRPAIDPSLPRVRVEHDLSEQEKAQFTRVQRIGEEVSETIEYTPAKLLVLQHARLKYLRGRPGQQHRTHRQRHHLAAAPQQCGPGLLAHVLVAKYLVTTRWRARSVALRAWALPPRGRRCATGRWTAANCWPA